MAISKEEFLSSLEKDNPYCYIMGPTNKDKGEGVGYINSQSKLMASIASLSATHNYKKVRVCWGRNIMNVDSGPITFDVNISIK